jgi:hypothetical protein
MTFEKRGYMPYRKSLVSTLWLTSLLALLAFVLVAPTRPCGFVSVSTRSDCLCLDFAPPPGQPTADFSAAMDTDPVVVVNAFSFEDDEEQDRAVASDEPGDSFVIPCSFHKLPDHQLIAPLSIISFYPLRC